MPPSQLTRKYLAIVIKIVLILVASLQFKSEIFWGFKEQTGFTNNTKIVKLILGDYVHIFDLLLRKFGIYFCKSSFSSSFADEFLITY